MEFCGGSGDGIQKNRSEEKEVEPYKQVEPSRAREGKEPKEEVSRLLCTPSDWSGTASGQGAHEKLPAPGAHPIFFLGGSDRRASDWNPLGVVSTSVNICFSVMGRVNY